MMGFLGLGGALVAGGVWGTRTFFRAGPIPQVPSLWASPSEHGIGRLVPNVEFTDLQASAGNLAQYCSGSAVVVVALRDTGCPICKKTGPKLAEIEKRYANRGVRFLYVNVNPVDTPETMRAEVDALGLSGTYVADPTRGIASALGAKSTSEVFIMDSARTLRYRGAVDDQYGIGFTRPRAEHEYLDDALVEVLSGMRPVVEATTAPGCLLPVEDLPKAWSEPETITYHNRISRIIDRNCVSCHRTNGMGPFSLEAVADLSARQAMVKHVVETGLMPAWPAAKGTGPWINDRSLADADRDALLKWMKEGFVVGDPADAARTREWNDDIWEIGTPDLVLEFPEAFTVPAEGFVDYQFVFLNTKLPEDKWVQAIEIKPTVRDVVHHLAVWVGDAESGPESEESFKGQHGGKFDKKGFMAIIVPGQGPTVFPQGTAKFMYEGAWLKFQMHYTPNGREVIDRPKVAFKFADKPPQHEIFTNVCISRDFVIPAGAANHEVTATFRFKEAGVLRAFHPHMHLRGKSFRFDLKYPNGEKREVLRIDKWSFKWQLVYELAQPIEVPAGTELTATAVFDNSRGNPLLTAEDTEKTVKFGRLSTDEMMLGYFEWYKAKPLEVDASGSPVADPRGGR